MKKLVMLLIATNGLIKIEACDSTKNWLSQSAPTSHYVTSSPIPIPKKGMYVHHSASCPEFFSDQCVKHDKKSLKVLRWLLGYALDRGTLLNDEYDQLTLHSEIHSEILDFGDHIKIYTAKRHSESLQENYMQNLIHILLQHDQLIRFFAKMISLKYLTMQDHTELMKHSKMLSGKFNQNLIMHHTTNYQEFSNDELDIRLLDMMKLEIRNINGSTK